MTESELNALVARLAVLESEREIIRAHQRYARAVDYGLHDEFVGRFAPEARFVVRSAADGRVSFEVSGHQQLADFIVGHSRPPGRWHKHFLMLPVIEIDGNTATADGYFIVALDRDGSPTTPIFGRSHDRFCRLDGEWKIAERVLDVESRDPDMPHLARR